MKITENFNMEEFAVSGSYPKLAKLPIEGSKEWNNIIELVKNLLQPIRTAINAPMKITSGYRSKELNKKVGGAVNSNHLYGMAADVQTTDNISMVKVLRDLGVDFDECIIEYPKFKNDEIDDCKWVHLAYNKNNNRKKTLYYCGDGKGYRPFKINNEVKIIKG